MLFLQTIIAFLTLLLTTCRLTLYHRIKLKKKKRKRSKETHQRRRFDQNAFVKEEYNQFHHLARQPDISRCIEFQAALQELTAKKIETNPSNSIRIGCRDKNTRESRWNNGLCNIHVHPRAYLGNPFWTCNFRRNTIRRMNLYEPAYIMKGYRILGSLQSR